MPDAALFTPAFVESFIRKCHAEGLTKEATVALLEAAALSAAHNQEGFAAGFSERMAQDDLMKQASRFRGLGRLARRGFGFARRHPGITATSALGMGTVGAGLAGAAAYGINAAVGGFRNHNRDVWPDVPVIGGYSADDAKLGEQEKLNRASRGVGELNAAVDKTGKRVAELQDVIDSNGPGAASAIGELQRLRQAPYASQRDQYGRQLDEYSSDAADQLAKAQADLKSLNASRGSLWNKTRKFFGMPADLDGRERELIGQTGRLAEQQRLSERLRDRLRSGSTEFATGGVPSRQTLQQRFFPTE